MSKVINAIHMAATIALAALVIFETESEWGVSSMSFKFNSAQNIRIGKIERDIEHYLNLSTCTINPENRFECGGSDNYLIFD